VRISADARLALPVTVAWGTLAAILLMFGEQGESLVLAARVGCATALVLSVISLRWIPLLALTAGSTAAVLLGLALQSPTHIEIAPWDAPQHSASPWFLAWADPLRHEILEQSRNMPSVGGQLLPGLAIGDTSNVSDALKAVMKSASLTHITAVSGANCVIVTAGIMAVASLCGVRLRWRILVALCALGAFVVLVTPQPSVVRAALMASVVLVSRAAGRPSAGLPLLAGASLLVLLVDPWWAIDVGFLLSVTATFGLLVLSRPLTTGLSRLVPEKIAAIIAIPLAAQLMCQPFIVLLTPSLPTYGIVANIVAGPAAALATVPGLLACLTLPWLPALGTVLLWVAWVPSEWIGQTAQFVAGLPLPALPWLSGGIGVLVSGLFSVATVCAIVGTGRLRHGAIGLIAVSCVGYLGLLGWNHVARVVSMPSQWQVAACDVGQGDALLIRSGEHVALVDTGRQPAPLAHCLSQLGITSVDLLVLTHYDLDHVGGYSAVVGKVSRALVGTPENSADEHLVKELVAGGAIVQHGEAGLNGTLGEGTWSILWPDPARSDMQGGNPGSITLWWQDPTLSAIFLGDLGQDAQDALRAHIRIPPVDLVKVAHHGSADQSPEFYRLLQPQVALISVGAHNTYGHPTGRTLDLLASLGTKTLRTDQSGLVLVWKTRDAWHLWHERASVGGGG
jgi:competence protein ComEC